MTASWWRILFLICVVNSSVTGDLLNEDGSDPVVHTSVGSIRGQVAQDGDYSMFMGIPYAEVNRSNVFGPAIPYPKFKDTFNASDDSAICPQREEFNQTIVGSLDCLHLNIYVPNSASPNNRLPVLVWIYGGVFQIGFAGRYLYGPSSLVRHDVILVTLNYRLGIYGFMCLDIPEVPGNQGLKDQLMALQWIKKNIAAFGGDDTKITLGGQSVGSTSVDHHVHFRKENLFSKVILQGGNTANELAVQKFNHSVPFMVAKELNYTSDDLHEVLRYLNKANALEVIGASKKLDLKFAPCVEKPMKDVDNYVTEHPINVAPIMRDIDVLIGFNSHERISFFHFYPEKIKNVHNFPEILLNDYFDFTGNVALFNKTKEILKAFYFNGTNDISYLEQQIGVVRGDFDFCHSTIQTIKKYINNGVTNIYLYLFSYNGERNFVSHKEKLNTTAATHADELGYLFDISYMKNFSKTEDKAIIDKMTTLWTNFIKYGNPTPKPSELIPVLWPRLTQDSWQYLELNSRLRVSSRPFRRRMAFLDLLFLMNEEHQKGRRRKQERSAAKSLDLSMRLMCVTIVFHTLFDSCHFLT